MPGFSIYVGDLVSGERLRTVLENYSNTREVESAGETIDLIDKVISYRVKETGIISFIYQYDKRTNFQFRDETVFQTRTFSVAARIIRGASQLFFLLEIVRGASHSEVLKELFRVIYGDGKKHRDINISSLSINQIENEDSRIISGEAYRGLSARDKTMLLFGTLSARLDDGSRDHSEIHEIYNSGDKTYTNFLSLTRGCFVYISGKKSSVSLKNTKDTHVTLDDVERYIIDFIIPRISVDSGS
jgi:hypothetical protein